jgi:hypothetical protein
MPAGLFLTDFIRAAMFRRFTVHARISEDNSRSCNALCGPTFFVFLTQRRETSHRGVSRHDAPLRSVISNRLADDAGNVLDAQNPAITPSEGLSVKPTEGSKN